MKDLAKAKNLLECIKRGKFELTASECVAFAESIAWLSEYLKSNSEMKVIKQEPIDKPKSKRGKK